MVEVDFRPNTYRSFFYRSDETALMAQGTTGWRLSIHSNVWAPPTDVYETDERLVVRVEIAGMKESDFQVRLDQNRLTISGVRQAPPETGAYQRMEIQYGEFASDIEFFVPVDMSKVEADYENGFLVVVLPKAKPRQIVVD